MKGQDMEIGTLRELNVKPGDVVECVDGSIFASTGRKYTINEKCGIYGLSIEKVNLSTFRIVSRASDTPKLWRDMTDAEKGALLLAHHEGKVIESSRNGADWATDVSVGYCGDVYYRVKPEPVRELERVSIVNSDNITIGHGTIETENGKPDCSTIKMEEIVG